MEFLEGLGLSSGMIEKLMDYAVQAASAVAILFAALILGGWASGMVKKGLERAKFDLTLTKFAAKLVRWLVFLLGFLVCLSVFGIETTSFAAVLGAAGLAIGLAFQGSLSNFAGGVMLLVFRPFKVGDLVTVEGKTGTIDEIGIFATKLDTFGNRRIIVPNNKAFDGVIENVSFNRYLRVDVDVGVAYGSKIDETRKVLEKAAAAVETSVKDPAPSVFLSKLGDSAVEWQVRTYSTKEDYWDIYQATIRAVKMELDSAGIGIPFPQMDVHVHNPS